MSEKQTYDVFISHAFEDKAAFANELAAELKRSGLKVWYSGFHLQLGSSIAGSINEALKDAAFAIVVLSPIYLQKQWAMNELNALLAMETRSKRILPILHEITIDEVKALFPIVADRYAVPSTAGMEVIIKKVRQAMDPHGAGLNEQPVSRAEPTTKAKSGEPAASGMQSARRASAAQNKKSNATASRWRNAALIIILIVIATVVVYQATENTTGTAPQLHNDHYATPE